MSAIAFCDVCHRDLAFLARIAVDRLLVGRSGLIHGALGFRAGHRSPGRAAPAGRCRARPVGGRARRSSAPGRSARLRPLERGLARRDDLRARAGIDVCELRIGDDLGGQRLLVLRDRFGIVDPHQHGVGGDVLAAHDGNVRDAPVDPRRDVEPRRVHLALHQQRLGPHQIPDRQAGDGGDDHAHHDRRNPGGQSFPVSLLFLVLAPAPACATSVGLSGVGISIAVGPCHSTKYRTALRPMLARTFGPVTSAHHRTDLIVPGAAINRPRDRPLCYRPWAVASAYSTATTSTSRATDIFAKICDTLPEFYLSLCCRKTLATSFGARAVGHAHRQCRLQSRQRPFGFRRRGHLHQCFAVEHDLVGDLADPGQPRRWRSGMSSATVTVTSTYRRPNRCTEIERL